MDMFKFDLDLPSPYCFYIDWKYLVGFDWVPNEGCEAIREFVEASFGWFNLGLKLLVGSVYFWEWLEGFSFWDCCVFRLAVCA